MVRLITSEENLNPHVCRNESARGPICSALHSHYIVETCIDACGPTCEDRVLDGPALRAQFPPLEPFPPEAGPSRTRSSHHRGSNQDLTTGRVHCGYMGAEGT